MLSWFDEVNEPEAIEGQTDLLIQAAKSMGVSEDEVLALLDLGYDPCEIEELLYNPALLHEAAAELLYAYYRSKNKVNSWFESFGESDGMHVSFAHDVFPII